MFGFDSDVSAGLCCPRLVYQWVVVITCTCYVTSQRLVLLDLSVFGYLAFKDSFPSGAS
jgi:hypothetical protein